MRDIVIVPTYDRPEFLAVCLEKLVQARGIEEKELWICQDFHIEDKNRSAAWHELEMVPVLEEARRQFGSRFRYVPRKPHNFYGNSFNLMAAFVEACAAQPRYTFLIEDDVMVMPDYFQWHAAAQEKWNPFVSCAGRINRSLNFALNGPEAIDESCRDGVACVSSLQAYISWATCFTSSSLRRILLTAAGANFFSWADQSCCGARPGHEQDIVIQEMMKRVKTLSSVWPYVPRAYHMGWHSYHRPAGVKFNGSLSERVDALRKAIVDPAKIRDMAGLQDIDPYPKKEIEPWDPALLYLRKN